MCVGIRYEMIVVDVLLCIVYTKHVLLCIVHTEHEGFRSKPTNDNMRFTKGFSVLNSNSAF